MAIEFHCPYCTSTIQVPDNSAGKKGTCPRCGTAILVPAVEVPTQPAIASEPPPDPSPVPLSPVEPQFAPPPADAEPRFPGPPPAAPGEFPPFEPVAAATADQQPSYARALKRRRKKRGMGLLVPIIGAVALVLTVVYIITDSQPQLTAVALDDFQPPPGGVGRNDVANLQNEVVDYVLDELSENPARLISGLMETEFRGISQGIEVYVFEGKKTRFFRVATNKDFDAWVKDNAAKLERSREKEFQAAVKRFFIEYEENQGDLPDLKGYRDSMGLGAMVGRVGFNMTAVVGKQAYRCVYEDNRQRLYFLLPRDTRQFELVGRKLNDGSTIFPGRYTVKVQ